MDIIIRGNSIKITDSLEEYATKKVSRLDRYMPNITEVRVDLSRQHTKRGEDLTIAQITLKHSRGAILRSEEKLRGEDRDATQKAINTAVDKMYRQIDRFKGKRSKRGKSKRNDSRFMATPEELAMVEEIPPEEFTEVTEEYSDDYDDGIEIIRRKQVVLGAMTEQEAIEQMELLGHNFFMFMNGETGQVNVLYRRSSDGYGVLVPES